MPDYCLHPTTKVVSGGVQCVACSAFSPRDEQKSNAEVQPEPYEARIRRQEREAIASYIRSEFSYLGKPRIDAIADSVEAGDATNA